MHENTIENFGKLMVHMVLNSGNTFGNLNTIPVLTFLEIEKCQREQTLANSRTSL
jgi:hypothetical protein